MKKIFTVILAFLLCFCITACGSEKVSNKQDDSKEYFEDNVINLHMVRIEIVNSEIAPPGSKYNKYNDESLIIFNAKVTNKSSSDFSAYYAWTSMVEVFQDNDSNVENRLPEVVLTDYSNKNDNNTIKKNETVDMKIGYRLDDNKNPVRLKAVRTTGALIGEQTYPVDK